MAVRTFSKVLIHLGVAALIGSASQLSYAQEKGSGKTEGLEEVVVRAASRLPPDLTSVPGSVTVLDEQALQEQTQLSTDLGQLLARAVPGMGPVSPGSLSNFGQTLRGRKPAIFIDGVPVTVPLRSVSRDLRTIAPGALARIEVINGATAIYGLGGGGGLINYVTRDPRNGPLELRTDLSVSGSLTHAGDSTNYSVQQSALGGTDRFGFVASGFYEKYDSLFDADGDMIPPDPYAQGGIAESEAYNLFAKVSYDIAEGQQLRASFNTYDFSQSPDFRSGVGLFPVNKTPVVNGSPPGAPQLNRNKQATVGYTNQDVFLGSDLSVAAYYSDFKARFAFATTFAQPNTPHAAGGQSEVVSEHYGARVDLRTPLPVFESNVLWGFDLGRDRSAQPLTDGRYYSPIMKQKTFAPFAQIELKPFSRLNVVGGIRHESADIDVPTFTTIKNATHPGGFTVQGGELKYSDTLYNIGIVVSPFTLAELEPVKLFAGYSQGFTVSDLGRSLRTATVPSISVFSFEAQVVNSYEAGVRADWSKVHTSLAFFRSTSEFGSTFNTVTFELIRAPEKVWGGEFRLDYTPTETASVGFSAAWSNGVRTDIDQPLDTSRINPFKGTAYYEQRFVGDWNVRAQVTYSGEQDRFPGSPIAFGRYDVEPFTLVDLIVGKRLGPVRASLGIANLFNEKYYPPGSWQDAINSDFVTGTGATARLNLSIQY